ncbi:septum site-determining protein MinC [Lacticaseibacillus baoqingensis]|uniref:Septum site-determining protein MinC n=1 Tax=Lacticaseibacillus baoqingensis TaxID=2486013 RepID=A0ABW4E165_9LACO|nr:septum site-determining protein MinC [Lacticaseibacillus baoqingensis]
MDAVILKGRKDGFELQLADDASWEAIFAGLETLLHKLASDTPEGDVEFTLTTGNRLLSMDQQTQIQRIFDRFARFEVKTIQALVADTATLKAQCLARSVHLVGGIIRSGQVQTYTGDVLFLGTLHRSGTLQATGSIFVMGSVEGLLIAGANGDQQAVIGGDISHAGQIRIADTVEIIEANDYSAQTLTYINDLHILEHGQVAALAQLRPKLFRKLEDF